LWRVIWREVIAALLATATLRIMTSKNTAAPPRQRLSRFLPGRGRNWIVALSRVNAVFANDIRQLGQKLPEPGVLFDQRMSFVGRFVAAKGGLVAAKGVLKQ
jgi:hypothetical protein